MFAILLGTVEIWILIISFFVGSEGMVILMACLFGFTATLTICIFISNRHYQKNRFESIRCLKATREIWQETAKAMNEDYINWLGKMYPEFEKSLLKDLKPGDGASAVLSSMYPDLKTAGLIKALAESIGKNHLRIADASESIQYTLRECRKALVNPWFPKGLIPEIPEDVKE